jgi:hypothetical protein
VLLAVVPGVVLIGLVMASLGLLVAGTLSAELTTAVTNALFLGLLLLGGVAVSADVLPPTMAALGAASPLGAGVGVLRALLDGTPPAAVPWRRCSRSWRCRHPARHTPDLPLGGVSTGSVRRLGAGTGDEPVARAPGTAAPERASRCGRGVRALRGPSLPFRRPPAHPAAGRLHRFRGRVRVAAGCDRTARGAMAAAGGGRVSRTNLGSGLDERIDAQHGRAREHPGPARAAVRRCRAAARRLLG